MKRFILSSVIAVSFAAALPAAAKKYPTKYEANIPAQITTPVKLEIMLGENLAHRANNMPLKSDPSHVMGIRGNKAFGGNGYYGEKDLTQLTERLSESMAARLAKQGLTVTDNAATTLRVVILDARPNHPTFTQMSKQPALSFQSVGNGGAAFKGELVSASGQSLGHMSYGWYENDIRDASYGHTWSDANRAIDRFAKKAAKSLTN